MNKTLWIKILESSEEDKLASLLEGLSEDEKKELASVYEEDVTKTAKESPEGTENQDDDVEKVAADYYAAGKIFAKGFIDELSASGE